VENHQSFIRAQRGHFSFDYYGWVLPQRVDTRYYVASKREFCEVLRHAYLNVDEAKGIDLETAYVRALRSTQLKDYVSSVVPLIRGLSGSMGVQYFPSRSRALLKGMRNKLVRALLGRTTNDARTK
jgi:hypothetical protein